jgi:antitoxin PrlF
MITSRISRKARTTIPQAVRKALGLRGGDTLVYVVDNDRAVLTRFDERRRGNDPFATFREWSSPGDAEAYGKL